MPEYPIALKLKHPIEHGSVSVEELSFRRGRAGDMKGLVLREGELPFDDLLLIAGRLCGQTREVMAKIDEEDLAGVVEIAMGFYMRCLLTGRTA